MEVWYESSYISNGSSSNTILELDGSTDPANITSLAQTFSVDKDNEPALLSFDLSARSHNTGGGQVAQDPVLIEILDSSNNAIFSQVQTPTSVDAFTNFQFNVTFPTAGNYTLKFTEQGTSNGDGSLLDNVSLTVCFAAGTQIMTPEGEVAVEALKVGDRVLTLDSDAQVIKWIGSKRMSWFDLIANPKLYPVRVRKNALGSGMPDRDLHVSPQHRILVRSKVAQRVLGDFEALVPAIKLVGHPGIEIDKSVKEVEYFHFALEHHSIVHAQATYAETLYLGPQACEALGEPAVEELNFCFRTSLTLMRHQPPHGLCIPITANLRNCACVCLKTASQLWMPVHEHRAVESRDFGKCRRAGASAQYVSENAGRGACTQTASSRA